VSISGQARKKLPLFFQVASLLTLHNITKYTSIITSRTKEVSDYMMNATNPSGATCPHQHVLLLPNLRPSTWACICRNSMKFQPSQFTSPIGLSPRTSMRSVARANNSGLSRWLVAGFQGQQF
jgi:hypothetical protein